MLRASQYRSDAGRIRSNKLLTTIAYQLDGKRSYALEGSIFVAGAAVQWLRDGLHIVHSAAETGALAAAADPTQEVILVPAFVGLGAPYWRPDVRGALFGLTRATGPRELAQAALESVCFQTADLLAAMKADWRDAGSALKTLRVDGGMANSDWFMQRLADHHRQHRRPSAESRKPPRSAPPISPACMPDFFPSRIGSWSTGA